MKRIPFFRPASPVLIHSPLWLESAGAMERARARRQWRLFCVLAAGIVCGFVVWLVWAVPAVKTLISGT